MKHTAFASSAAASSIQYFLNIVHQEMHFCYINNNNNNENNKTCHLKKNRLYTAEKPVF